MTGTAAAPPDRTSPPRLAYAHLNLTRNPFGELEPGEWARLAVVSRMSAWLPSVRPGSILQFVGPPGHGKTTRLLAIRYAMGRGRYCRLPESGRARVPRAPMLFVDDAQRLTPPGLRRLARRRVPLVLATHHRLDEVLCRYATVRTIPLEGHPARSKLEAIFGSRIEAARRDAGPVPVVSPATCTKLIAAFGGDVRGMLHRLYDALQTMREVGRVPV